MSGGALESSILYGGANNTISILLLAKVARELEHAESPVSQKYMQAQIAYYDHQIAMWKVMEAIYAWQEMAADVMMALVGLVVLARVTLSGFQL
jgi:hypothetical protein